jgi:hypothetical protein
MCKTRVTIVRSVNQLAFSGRPSLVLLLGFWSRPCVLLTGVGLWRVRTFRSTWPDLLPCPLSAILRALPHFLALCAIISIS